MNKKIETLLSYLEKGTQDNTLGLEEMYAKLLTYRDTAELIQWQNINGKKRLEYANKLLGTYNSDRLATQLVTLKVKPERSLASFLEKGKVEQIPEDASFPMIVLGLGQIAEEVKWFEKNVL